jgi:hypothetical protein
MKVHQNAVAVNAIRTARRPPAPYQMNSATLATARLIDSDSDPM